MTTIFMVYLLGRSRRLSASYSSSSAAEEQWYHLHLPKASAVKNFSFNSVAIHIHDAG